MGRRAHVVDCIALRVLLVYNSDFTCIHSLAQSLSSTIRPATDEHILSKMAFQSERALIKCAVCKEEFKYFKTMESENPMTHEKGDPETIGEYWNQQTMQEHWDTKKEGASSSDASAGKGVANRGFSGDASAGGGVANRGFSGDASSGDGTTKRGFSGGASSNPTVKLRRVCPVCELDWRLANQHLYPEDKDWATMPRVTKDMKFVNKGKLWASQGQHYKAACEIVAKCQKDTPMTKAEAAKMKTAKSKELATQLLATIKSGRLFSAFMGAGNRLNIAEEICKECDIAYAEYLADPENVQKLARLEELEDKVAEQNEYKTANGDVDILKALDFHNDMSHGFNLFDCCRAKVHDHAQI